MSTASYWKKRFLDLENASNAYGQQTFAQIESTFDRAQREIQREIESWYGRYAKNNNITMQEARRQLSTRELREFRWDVKEYIKYGRENAVSQQWMKELENASARVHVSRLEALKIRTQHSAEVAFGNELDFIDAMARRVYTEDYYHAIYEMQKGFGIGWEIGQIDERKLETLITKPWAADGKNFSERIWGQRTQLVNELHNQLTRTCIMGKAPDDAINAIAKKFDTTKNQAGRLVMTEQAYFHSVAQKDAFAELDVEEFEVVATLDSHTSEICQEMDGQHFPMKDYQPGVTAPPFHVWCRSVTVPWFEDNFTGERAARDEDGNTYYVPDSMTYKEWKKSMVDGNTGGLTVVEDNLITTPKPSNDDKYNNLLAALQKRSVDYNPVRNHTKQLSQEEMITALAGGDMTSGSCASVGLAYIGQRQGWDVLDFRDGHSRRVFASSFNLLELSQMNGMKVLKAEGASSITVGNRLLKMCEVGREYYLAVGRHAAIVRKTTDGVYQYLELQSSRKSGWIDFDGNPRYTLKTRFGCTSTSSGSSYYDFMLDIEESDFSSTDDFKTLLGFLNTAVDAQRKGSSGTIK